MRSLERGQQMTTKREYLKQQGITVGARGRFSGAAKVALQEALSKGVTFTAETKVQKAK
jgi:histone H3/H4